MTDANSPSTPQSEPSPGSGGYGFPPGPPASGGYGYPPGPPAQGGYGPPSGPPPISGGGYGFPQQGQPNPYQQEPAAPHPYRQEPDPGQGGGQWPPQQPDRPQGQLFTPAPAPEQPDWEAMADRSESERRKKRWWMLGGAVTVLALLAGGGAFLLLGTDKGEGPSEADSQPSVSSSPTPEESGATKAPAYSATVEGDATLLRDSNGKAAIRLAPDMKLGPLGSRFQIVGRGTGNSYAQSAEPVVDVSKSFTLTARVYNSAAKGSHIALSQGDGESFSFELGVNEVNGKQAWIFRVQTGDKGAAATAKTVTAEGLSMVKTATMLMATYDAEKKTIALYVDGKKAQEAQVPPIWQAQGPLQLGRSKHHNIWTGPWQGALHNIRVYDTALTAEQAAAYKEGKLGGAVKPTHSWLLT
ncbi:LamG-like jellyroll fold domain-containing protein [Streptomyces sp. cmx-4-9]|uniref:LamG-like jellyroll fold domain-containing protein n=1 Tax=Streptomyces sp. cmx-4-9 TaxID=2790941 RepID=UPI0039815CC8